MADMTDHSHHDGGEDTDATTGKTVFADETRSSKVLSGSGFNDTLTVSTDGQVSNQWHIYTGKGNDTINLDVGVSETRTISQGHHVFGNEGRDTFRFVGLDDVRGTMVGRLDDFNPHEDRIMIGDQVLNLAAPQRITGYDVYFTSIPNYSSPEMRDEQIWLVIETANGRVLYAIEGARRLPGSEDEESHFLHWNAVVPDVLPRVPFVYKDDYYRTEDLVDYVAHGTAVRGTNGDDTYVANGTHLNYEAGQGDDHVTGSAGDDLIQGDRGNDTMLGGAGNDTIEGYLGDDLIEGGAGNDLLNGDKGRDTLRGGAGDDKLYGGIDNDLLDGGEGDDTLYGGTGDDTLLGGAGEDLLLGGYGNDMLNGGLGRDIVDGGFGNDTIMAGAGDVITGGAGRNMIVVSPVGTDGETTKGAAILRDYSPDDVIRFAPAKAGPIDVLYAFDMAGNLVMADADLNPLLVVRANEIRSFDIESVTGAASFTQAATTFEGDLYKAGLAEVDLTDDDAITIMDPSIPSSPSEPEPEEPEDPEDDGEDKSSGSCFVATAVYGSADHPDVVSLRRIRDEVLVRSVVGRGFVRLYWAVGPRLAAHVREGSMMARGLRRVLTTIARFR